MSATITDAQGRTAAEAGYRPADAYLVDGEWHAPPVAEEEPMLSDQARAVYYGLCALGVPWPQGTTNRDIGWLARLLVGLSPGVGAVGP